jgi:hypothetical protein
MLAQVDICVACLFVAGIVSDSYVQGADLTNQWPVRNCMSQGGVRPNEDNSHFPVRKMCCAEGLCGCS